MHSIIVTSLNKYPKSLFVDQQVLADRSQKGCRRENKIMTKPMCFILWSRLTELLCCMFNKRAVKTFTVKTSLFSDLRVLIHVLLTCIKLFSEDIVGLSLAYKEFKKITMSTNWLSLNERVLWHLEDNRMTDIRLVLSHYV